MQPGPKFQNELLHEVSKTGGGVKKTKPFSSCWKGSKRCRKKIGGIPAVPEGVEPPTF